LAIAWGLTIVLCVVGGIVIAPTLFLTPSMLVSILNYALIGVAVGGLESPLGAWLGGVIVGLVESVASNVEFIGSELKFGAVMVFLLIMLTIKPRGLWGKLETRKV
jgi:branched-chain amino acid transport system permease protein